MEHDLLGELAVPGDAYYGVHTTRALRNFAVSGIPIGQHPELVTAIAAVKQAAAAALPRLRRGQRAGPGRPGQQPAGT
jgi:aspartate ammonia-lyase